MRIGLSRSTQYAIRAMLSLARHPDGATIKELSREEGLPQDYLSKTFQILARKDLLRSQKGPGGGFYLAVPLNRISLKKVIEAVEGPIGKKECFLGLKRCISLARPCPIHRICERSGRLLSSMFEKITLSEVGGGYI